MIKTEQRLCEGLRLVKASPRKYYVYYNHACAGPFSQHNELHKRLDDRGNMIRFSEASEILLGIAECRPILQATQPPIPRVPWALFSRTKRRPGLALTTPLHLGQNTREACRYTSVRRPRLVVGSN
jgi:hypothetical protein